MAWLGTMHPAVLVAARRAVLEDPLPEKPAELRAILRHAKGCTRPVLLTHLPLDGSIAHSAKGYIVFTVQTYHMGSTLA